MKNIIPNTRRYASDSKFRSFQRSEVYTFRDFLVRTVFEEVKKIGDLYVSLPRFPGKNNVPEKKMKHILKLEILESIIKKREEFIHYLSTAMSQAIAFEQELLQQEKVSDFVDRKDISKLHRTLELKKENHAKLSIDTLSKVVSPLLNSVWLNIYDGVGKDQKVRFEASFHERRKRSKLPIQDRDAFRALNAFISHGIALSPEHVRNLIPSSKYPVR